MSFLILALSLFFEARAAASVSQFSDQLNQNNLSIQGHGMSEEAEKAKTGYLGRSFLPSVLLELGQEKFQTGRYKTYGNPYGSLEARFNLFRGGRDRIEAEFRDIQAKIAGQTKDLAVREELNKVRKLQWQIIHNEELIKILELERKQNESLKEQANRRARSGISTKSDILEFSIYDSEILENLESLRHEIVILKIGLSPLLGISPEKIQFTDVIEHQHDEELLSSTFSSKGHPRITSLTAESDLLELQKTSIKRWWTPSVDVYGGYYLYTLRDRDYLAQDLRDDRVIGVRLTLELFDGLRSYNQASVVHYQAASKRLMAKHFERQTDASFRILQEDLKYTHEVMHYVESRIAKSRDYLKVTLQEYDRGVKNSLDALTAMQRYFRYEKQYLGRKKEYQIIKADLLAVLGE